MYKIFIVEDDYSFATALSHTLTSWGYEVITCTDFHNIIDQFLKCDPHLVLLDLILPYKNGFHWCKELRNITGVPIVFLSSANENMNLVMAMNLGADDFIIKPVDSLVLTTKLDSILRRVYQPHFQSSILKFGEVLLNQSTQTLQFQDQTLNLTKNEFLILETLLQKQSAVVSRENLMIRLWENGDFIEENTLTVNVSRLRKKLASMGLADWIITHVGQGYSLGELS